jgi:hypothetical protein
MMWVTVLGCLVVIGWHPLSPGDPRLEATATRRPELLEDAALSKSDREFLARLRREQPHEADPNGDASGQRKRT